MSVLDLFKRSAAPVALSVGLVFSSTNAFAIEQGTCLPLAEMNKVMKAEGQRSLIVSEEFTADPASRPLSVFTSNSDGSRGYNLVGDKAAHEKAPTNLCVGFTLRSVRLHDAGTGKVPDSFLIGGLSEAAVKGICNAEKIDGCGQHNAGLFSGAAYGRIPMLQAEALYKAGSGKEVPSGKVLTVLGRMSDGKGNVEISDARGVRATTLMLEKVAYTPTAIAMFKERQAPVVVAAVVPR
jgi:hypothetical protein